jgi:hypothetical protein
MQLSTIKLHRSKTLLVSALLVSAIALYAVVFSGIANAAITAVFGNAIFVAPPASVMPNVTEGPDILAFNELQDYNLTSTLDCDITAPGDYPTVASLTPGTIVPPPGGLLIDSHYSHFDPVMFNSADGRIEYDGEIICVIVGQANLDSSNFLGNPGTVYPLAPDCAGLFVHCGLELSPDRIRVGFDWIRLGVEALDPGDNVRVVTCAKPDKCQYQIDMDEPTD